MAENQQGPIMNAYQARVNFESNGGATGWNAPAMTP